MIEAIIADVDGVMVGKQETVNFPLPHTAVIKALGNVAQSGIPIVLCTAKFRAGIDEIIVQAHLDNPHITDGGALIIDPLGNEKIIRQAAIDKSIVQAYLSQDQEYTELYSATGYFVNKGADQEFMKKRSKLLQVEPILVDSLAEVADATPIIKIITFTGDDGSKQRVEAQVEQFKDRMNLIWSHHPYLLPRVQCIMTAPGVSKESAAVEVADHLGVPFDRILGIGDLPADWSFMQRCKYVATVGDNEELQRLAAEKDRHYTGKSVDENALLDILHHFDLLNPELEY